MLDKKLNLTKSIYEYLPTIKQVFKDFYGEKYDSLVEERLNNVTYIGYAFPSKIKNTLYEIEKEKTDDLIQEFFEENNIENTKENIKKYFGINPNFAYNAIINLNNLSTYLETENHTQFEEIEFLNSLKEITNQDGLQKDTKEYDQTIEKIKILLKSYQEKLNKFTTFQSQYKSYQDYIKSCEKLKDQIHNKYTDIFFSEIYEYLSEKDKKMIDNKNKETAFYPSNLECYDILIRYNYQLPSLIDAFTTESERKLETEETSNFEKENIKNDQIKYYKKIGIDLGDNYESYKDNPLCSQKKPPKEVTDKISKLRNSLYCQEQEEYITSTMMYQEQLNEINKLGLLDRDISYNYTKLSQNITCINPNVIKVEDTYKIHSLLLFSINQSNDYFDKNLLHEFNHLMELSKLKITDNQYQVLCGFDIVPGTLEDRNAEDTQEKIHREFELLNEIINELISQEITNQMHNQGIYLFDNKETAKIRGGTSYEKMGILVKDFYQTYKEDIIESRLTGNLEKLFSKVGYDNMIDLNQLVSEYGEHFSGFNYYQLIDDLKAKNDTEEVRYFKSSIEKANQILEKMTNQNQQQLETNIVKK